MRPAAGADNQHVFVPRRAQSRPDLRMVRGPEAALQRNLRDGNVGVGPCHQQRDPGPVIEPGIGVNTARQDRGAQQVGHPFGQFGVPQRVVAQIE
jgi:hypothetical protein